MLIPPLPTDKKPPISAYIYSPLSPYPQKNFSIVYYVELLNSFIENIIFLTLTLELKQKSHFL